MANGALFTIGGFFYLLSVKCSYRKLIEKILVLHFINSRNDAKYQLTVSKFLDKPI